MQTYIFNGNSNKVLRKGYFTQKNPTDGENIISCHVKILCFGPEKWLSGQRGLCANLMT